jgi:hypothetical protein
LESGEVTTEELDGAEYAVSSEPLDRQAILRLLKREDFVNRDNGPSIRLYPEPHESNPHTFTPYFFKIKCIIHPLVYFSKVIISGQVLQLYIDSVFPLRSCCSVSR